MYVYIYIHISMVEKVYIDKCSDDMCIPNKSHNLAVSMSVSHESASDVFCKIESQSVSKHHQWANDCTQASNMAL